MSGMSKEEMQLVVKAVDEASKNLKGIADAVTSVGSDAKAAGERVEGLGTKLGSLGNLIKAGFALSIGQDILGFITGGIEKLVSLIPEAIASGNEWAKTVEQIMRETGLGAVATSELLAVMRDLDVPVASSARLFAMFGKNLGENADLLKQLGVATVDANGKQLDAYQILQNLRHQFSLYGASLTETAAAQKLLGRTGFETLGFLQLTDERYQLLAQHARDVGLVLSGDVVEGAHAFNLEMRLVGDEIQGAQNQVFAGLLPTLTAFVGAFEGFLKQHMADIVGFVVNAANFVMGVIGGLLGLDFKAINLADVLKSLGVEAAKLNQSMPAAAKAAAAGEDALTKAIKAQVAAIDEQIRAIDAREAKRHAATQTANLQGAVDQARSQLQDLLGNVPSLQGLSAGEAEAAMQAYNQRVTDARKALADAIAKLEGDQADAHDEAEKAKLESTKQSLQKQLQAHQAHNKAVAAGSSALRTTQTYDTDAVRKAVQAGLAKMTADGLAWRDNGVRFAGDLKKAIGGVMDAILGPESRQIVPTNSGGSIAVTSRTGGLIGALRSIGSEFGNLEGELKHFFQWLNGLTRPLTPKEQAALIKNNPPGSQFTNLFSSLFGGGGHAMGGFIPPGGSSKVGEYAAETLYARAGGGVDVYPNPAAGGSSSGDGHGHPIYLDGRLVGQLLASRFDLMARTAPSSVLSVSG